MFNRCCLLLALAAAAATSSPVRADKQSPPQSYKEIAPGEKFVFVMLTPDPETDGVWKRGETIDKEIMEIRRAYPQSGMYRNDGSREPLWTVDWYAGVTLASDGVHVIRHGPWAQLIREYYSHPKRPDLNQEALSFFANGQLLRSYQIKDLVNDPTRLQRTSLHFWWTKEGRLDSHRMEYSLVTMDDNRFVFDVRTGSIVSDSRMALRILYGSGWVCGAAVGAVSLLLLGLWAISKMQRAEHVQPI
jgi:hypothetical protein